MSYIVGVTGGIGSGKSAVTRRLEERGITVVDADLAARVIVEPGTPALAAIEGRFGESVLLPDGALNRAELRKRVFSDEEQRLWLESLTHPLIGEEILRQLEASSSPYTVLASPLLLETSQRDLVDCVVVVDVPEEVQLSRTMARDDNDEAQVRRIMAAQLPRQERLAGADLVIDNTASLEELDARVSALHSTMLERAASK